MSNDEAWESGSGLATEDPKEVFVSFDEIVEEAVKASTALRIANCPCTPAGLLGLFMIILQNWPLVGLKNGELRAALDRLIEEEIHDRMERGE